MSIDELKQKLISADTEFAGIKVCDHDVFRMAQGRAILKEVFDSLGELKPAEKQ